MTTHLVRRIIQIPITLLVISVLVFTLIHLIPGDPIVAMLGFNASPELISDIRSHYGLDRPIHVQYLSWLGAILEGDFGRSIMTREPVLKMILDRLPSTLILAITATALGIALALPVGVLSAYKMNSSTDYILRTLAMLGVATPDFVVAIVLILIFAVRLQLVPIAGAPHLLKEPARAIPYYILPTITLGFVYAALVARLLRSSMLEVLAQDYIRVARAKGLSSVRVLWVHAIRNSLIPLITVLAVNFAYLLGGAAVMEQIFGLPGMGSMMIRAALERDYPLIQGVSMFVALIFIVSNLTADFLYTVIDPRLRRA